MVVYRAFLDNPTYLKVPKEHRVGIAHRRAPCLLLISDNWVIGLRVLKESLQRILALDYGSHRWGSAYSEWTSFLNNEKSQSRVNILRTVLTMEVTVCKTTKLTTVLIVRFVGLFGKNSKSMYSSWMRSFSILIFCWCGTCASHHATKYVRRFQFASMASVW